MRIIVVPKFDFEKTCTEITVFIEKTVKESGILGVVDLSGGLDNSLVATLYVRKLGKLAGSWNPVV